MKRQEIVSTTANANFHGGRPGCDWGNVQDTRFTSRDILADARFSKQLPFGEVTSVTWPYSTTVVRQHGMESVLRAALILLPEAIT